jgi:hypothetical protein
MNKIELQTRDLSEIVRKCESLKWDLKRVRIAHAICEDLTQPDELYVKLYLHKR